jgi:hypothetical protein
MAIGKISFAQGLAKGSAGPADINCVKTSFTSSEGKYGKPKNF